MCTRPPYRESGIGSPILGKGVYCHPPLRAARGHPYPLGHIRAVAPHIRSDAETKKAALSDGPAQLYFNYYPFHPSHCGQERGDLQMHGYFATSKERQ